MTVVNGVKFTVVHGRCHLCGKKCWSMVGGGYDFRLIGDNWAYECQVCTEALRRIEIEDAYAAHLEIDIDPYMAFRSLLSWMQEFPQGSDQWRTVWPKQGARLEILKNPGGLQQWSSVTFDESDSRAVPAWLLTRLDRQWEEIELFGEYRLGRNCRVCKESILKWRRASNQHCYDSIRLLDDVFRSLRRRHRRALARDLRRSVSLELRALIVQLRMFRALGGDVPAMAA
jgi:hypothetical protein